MIDVLTRLAHRLEIPMSIRRTVYFGLIFLTIFPPSRGQGPAYWPSQNWHAAAPESQGIDSGLLASAIERVIDQHLGVHSLLVIRHGYAVVDASFYPYDSGTPHDLASVTKTVTSVLTGIAVAQKLLRLDQPLLPLFPRRARPRPMRRSRRSRWEICCVWNRGWIADTRPASRNWSR